MGCQSTYSPPITIPTGLTGTGTSGTNGTDGTSLIVNGSGVSTGTGNQTISTETITGGTIAAGDVLEYEAICKVTSTYQGTIYFRFGTEVILTHTIGANDVYTPVPGSTDFMLLLKSKITFKTTSTEDYISSVSAIEDSVTTITSAVTSCSEDSANDITILIGCNPIVGTVTVTYFTVSKYKNAI